MKIKNRKIEDHMELIHPDKMKKILEENLDFWVMNMGLWGVTTKEFYIFLTKINTMAVEIYKTTGWRGPMNKDSYISSPPEKKEAPTETITYKSKE